MTSTGHEAEEARLRVIIETLAYAQPTLTLTDALPMIYEIETRVGMATSGSPRAPRSMTPTDIASWINAYGDRHRDSTGMSIVDLINVSKKINAIKEVRAITACGLKEAKEGVEEYVHAYL